MYFDNIRCTYTCRMKESERLMIYIYDADNVCIYIYMIPDNVIYKNIYNAGGCIYHCRGFIVKGFYNDLETSSRITTRQNVVHEKKLCVIATPNFTAGFHAI